MRTCGTLCLAACLLALGCAKAVPRTQAPVVPAVSPMTVAAGLFEAGCYRCLSRAFEIYQRALVAGGAPPAVRAAAFETALLLAMREKELGLDAAPWIERARGLSATPDDVRHVEMVAAVPWENLGLVLEFAAPPRPTPAAAQEWVAWLRRPEAGTLDQYILLAFICNPRGFNPPSTLDAFEPGSPILRYRLGLCGGAHRPRLDAVLAADPRFVEAGFFAGRYEITGVLQGRQWIARALPLLTTAHDGIPEATAITVTLAGVWRARNELARALALYDEALSLHPTQRDALLGRAITLTYLGRSDEAIDTATRMVDLGTWYLGDAYYWRAWNEYQTRRLDAAAADVAAARRFQTNGELLTLSGMVAYDQQRRTEARADFERARAMNDANCTASWYLGLIDADEGGWRPAATAFASAATCYRSAADALRAEADGLPEDLSPEAREQQASDYERRIGDSLRQDARSSFNAALASLRLGDRPAAIAHARVAAGHESMKERAETLLRTLTESANR